MINILSTFARKTINVIYKFIMHLIFRMVWGPKRDFNPLYTCTHITTEFKHKLIESMTAMEYCDIPPRFPWPPSYWFGAKRHFRSFFHAGTELEGEDIVYNVLEWCNEISRLCETDIIDIPGDHHILWKIATQSNADKGLYVLFELKPDSTLGSVYTYISIWKIGFNEYVCFVPLEKETLQDINGILHPELPEEE